MYTCYKYSDKSMYTCFFLNLLKFSIITHIIVHIVTNIYSYNCTNLIKTVI